MNTAPLSTVQRRAAHPVSPLPPASPAPFTRGLVGADQLAELMRRAMPQPISQLARWIVERQVVSVQGPAGTLLPLFQFTDDLAGLRPGLAATLAELSAVFSDEELALWWARGNSSLGGDAPADRLATQPLAVWQAARIDRFIATGT